MLDLDPRSFSKKFKVTELEIGEIEAKSKLNKDSKKIQTQNEIFKIENVILGAGSEGVISSIMRTFLLTDDEIISAKNSFIGFRILANASGRRTHWVPMKVHRYDLDAIKNKITDWWIK